MTLFGIIWVLLLAYVFLKKDIKYILFLTLLSMVFQSTNVLDFHSFSVGPQVITNIVFIIKYILEYKTIKISCFSKIESYVLLLFVIVLLSVFFNNTFELAFFKVLQLLVYIISFICFYNIKNKIDTVFINKSIKYIALFVLIMGIIQIITTTGILPKSSLISILFYNDHGSSVYYWLPGYDRLCSLFMEASYCGCFLIGILFYFISIWKKGEKHYFIILLTLLELLLTRSSTVYLSFGICFILFLFISKNKEIKKILLPLCITGCLVMLIFFPSVLDEVLFSKLQSGSANTRHYWNMNALEHFKNSIIIGTGYKSVRASSLFISLLAEIGVLGTLCYCSMNFNICINLFKKNRNTDLYISGICFAIFSIVCSQFIACPDLDFCVYWLFMFLFALIINSNNRKVRGVKNEMQRK